MKCPRSVLLAAACSAWCFTVACGGGSSHKANPIAASGQNVVPVSVDSGPDGNYANGIFVSVTVCVPSSSTCQTVPNVLVDTGSSGLRILSSALTISLPQQNGAGGPVAECLPFISGFTWRPVQTADVQIGGETASSVPMKQRFPSRPVVRTTDLRWTLCRRLGQMACWAWDWPHPIAGPCARKPGHRIPGSITTAPPPDAP